MDRQVAHQFLTALFSGKTAGHYILIWAAQDKQSFWARSVSEALDELERRVDELQYDCYIGCGLAGKNYGPTQRCKADDIVGIPGVWADIDFTDAAHKKTNLPTREQADKFINNLPISPTIKINSGHGYQVWWLFAEVWEFGSDAERVEAATLVQRWQGTLRALAREQGFDVDMVHDLSRVMRIPGTYNRKGSTVEPVVQVSYIDRLLYSSDYFREHVRADVVLPDDSKQDFKQIDLALEGANARLTAGMLEELCEDTQFAKTWNKRRKDLQDQSPSGYDLSLASQLAALNWDDQDIFRALVHFRDKHGEDSKLDRPDYYKRTIAKARGDRAITAAQERIVELAQDAETPVAEKRPAIIQQLRTLSKVNITRILRYVELELDSNGTSNGEDADEGERAAKVYGDPFYRLETEDGIIHLGEFSAISSQKIFRDKVSSASLKLVPKVKAAAWEAVIEAMLQATETVELVSDETEAGQVEDWLTGYLAQKAFDPKTDYRKVIEEGRTDPFVKEGLIHIQGADMKNWLRMRREGVKRTVFGRYMRHFGGRYTTVAIRVAGKVKGVAVWELPEMYSRRIISETAELARSDIT